MNLHIFSSFRKLRISVGVLLVGLCLIMPQAIHAASGGCDFMNSISFDVFAFFGFEYAAGETITVSYRTGPGTPTQGNLIANGNIVDSDGVPGTVSYTIPSTGTYDLMISTDTGMITGKWSCRPVGTSDGSKAGPPAMNLFDGRINNLQDQDVAAPVAIYDGSIKVYGVDPISGDGWLSVEISEEAIEAAGIPADAPVLLGQGKNPYTGIDIFVYRLPTGEFQLNTNYADGKPYIFAWDEDGNKWHFAA